MTNNESDIDIDIDIDPQPQGIGESAYTKTSRRAFSKLTVELVNEDLKSPGVQKMLALRDLVWKVRVGMAAFE
jgi:hypothetical protein